jgi:hypothetical protein
MTNKGREMKRRIEKTKGLEKMKSMKICKENEREMFEK